MMTICDHGTGWQRNEYTGASGMAAPAGYDNQNWRNSNMKKWHTMKIAAVLGLSLSAGAALAAGQAGMSSVGVMTGFMDYDDDRQLDNDNIYALTLGHNVTDRWTLEGMISRANTTADVPGGGDVDVALYGISALYHLDASGPLQPYLSAGVAALTTDTATTRSETDSLLTLGVGARYALLRNLALRGEARYMTGQDNFDDIAYLVGLGYSFGKPAPAPAPAPEPEPRPADSDGDGVYDDSDACPGTATDVVVDARGCPVMIESEVSIDLQVQFDTNKADVKPEYDARIGEVADFMKAHPDSTAVIEGHTDDRGDAAYNQQLSQRRADSVRAYLIEKKGVSADRITAVGYGEERPIADNATAAGRQANRRVVAVIKARVQKVKRK